MTQAARKICVVTGSRAEYGLLYWLLREIQADSRLQLQLVATGMHLAPEFGMTVRLIEADGFVADARVEMLVASDTPTGIAKSIGLGVIGFADAIERLKPDILVVLGDRFEILAAVQAAMVFRVPVAHIHGGELTEGLIDEAIRHAVTKMSQFHFVAAEPYRRRVLQLGETPEYVWNVGAMGLDGILRAPFMSREDLSQAVGIDLFRPYFLVTYHPVTLAADSSGRCVGELLDAIDEFPEYGVIFTGVNADHGNKIIQDAIHSYADRNQKRVHTCVSLGQSRYINMMRHASAVVGNSSSGMIEAPALKVPTVNIGERQRGRIRAQSVVDVSADCGAIVEGLRIATSNEFRRRLGEISQIFGDGSASRQIVEKLVEISLEGVLIKKFRDL